VRAILGNPWTVDRIRIRRLQSDDAELAVSAVGALKRSRIGLEDARLFLADRKHYLLVADDVGAPVGFLLGYRLNRLDRQGAKLFIYELEVARQYRRRGIGTALVVRINAIARRERMSSTFVLTNRSNSAAVQFFESTGARLATGDDLLFVYEG
jgi:ribosomal protein S18 acetylase RimI-like enzyme